MAYATPAHIPRSGVFLAIIIIELIFAVCELGLTAYLQYLYNESITGDANVLSGAIGVGIFTSVLTLITASYLLVTTRKVYKGYNKLAALALQVAGLIFWLVTWALFAKIMGLINTPVRVPLYDSYGYFTGYSYATGANAVSKGIFGAALAMALLEWILFIAVVVILGRGVRIGKTTASASGGPTTHDENYAKGTTAPDVEMTQEVNPAQPRPA